MIAGDTGVIPTVAAAITRPVDIWMTCSSALPVVGADIGTTKLICAGVTVYRGTGSPLNSTCVSPRDVGIGNGLAVPTMVTVSGPNSAVPVLHALFGAHSEASIPGARIGRLARKLAPLYP